MIRVKRVMIPQTPTSSAPRWFVEHLDENGVTINDLRNFDNETEAATFAYRQSLRLAADAKAKGRPL